MKGKGLAMVDSQRSQHGVDIGAKVIGDGFAFGVAELMRLMKWICLRSPAGQRHDVGRAAAGRSKRDFLVDLAQQLHGG